MKETKKGMLSLKELEAQVLAEGREWTRQRRQQKLAEQAREAGAVFPPPAAAATSPDPQHGSRTGDGGRRLRPRSPKR